MADVRLRLTKREQTRALDALQIGDEDSPTAFIMMGIELEVAQ